MVKSLCESAVVLITPNLFKSVTRNDFSAVITSAFSLKLCKKENT